MRVQTSCIERRKKRGTFFATKPKKREGVRKDANVCSVHWVQWQWQNNSHAFGKWYKPNGNFRSILFCSSIHVLQLSLVVTVYTSINVSRTSCSSSIVTELPHPILFKACLCKSIKCDCWFRSRLAALSIYVRHPTTNAGPPKNNAVKIRILLRFYMFVTSTFGILFWSWCAFHFTNVFCFATFFLPIHAEMQILQYN